MKIEAKTKTLSRRALLRGTGRAALGLPLLDIMRTRRVRASDTPRRIIFVFIPNGNEHSTRFAKTGETDFELGEFLAPLNPYRDRSLFLNGLNKRYGAMGSERADNHQQGGAGLAPWKSGKGSFPIGGTGGTIGYVQGPSVDYAIGSRVIADNPSVAQRHLVYRVGSRANNIWSVHAHGGPEGSQNPISPETNPHEAYARLFSDFNFDGEQPNPAALRKLAKRSSAIDLVLQDAHDLARKLGKEDKLKVDQHLESLRSIERKLQDPGASVSAACKPAELGATFDPFSDDNHEKVGELFFNISVAAFACDQSRVVNFAWGGNTSGRVYRKLGINEGHHDLSHKSDGGSFAKIRKIHKHLWTQNLMLHEALENMPEGDGSVWDNTLIVHWNELGQGDKHTINNDLVVLSGGAAGTLKAGRLLEYGGQGSFSDLLVNLFHYMGYEDVTSFGFDRLGTGKPLPDLFR